MVITDPMDSTTSNMFPYLYSKFRPEDKHASVVVILLILSILSVIGNIVVVLISGFYMRLRSLTSIFILNLALSDLVITIGPLFLIDNYIQGWTPKDAFCKIVWFALSGGFYINMVLLVLMTIQRYMVTVHSYSGWKKVHCGLIYVCAWMVGIMAVLPVPVHMIFLPGPEFCMYSSDPKLVSSIRRMNIIFVCASVIMCFCSIRILQTIIKSPTNQKHRTTVLVLPLTATFFICWAPYNIVIFLCTLDHYGIRLDWDHVLNAMYICTPLAFSRCCTNPVIYGLIGLKFCKEIFQKRAALNSAQIEMELNN